mmetsp:Transcript_31674/g.76867  ORF Transcript_31674/g.76867 Transcript_31674/m.76867 type:complete len:88 (+) Transcript_31674:3946-4209(+)
MGNERERFVDILGRCGKAGKVVALDVVVATGGSDICTFIAVAMVVYLFCFLKVSMMLLVYSFELISGDNNLTIDRTCDSSYYCFVEK